MRRRLTVWINEREALPLRAIPLLDGMHRFPADELVGRLEHRLEFNSALVAHTFVDGEVIAEKTSAWRVLASEMRMKKHALHEQYADDPDAFLAAWESASLSMLPPGIFVWADDFMREYRADKERISFTTDDENEVADMDVCLPNLAPHFVTENTVKCVFEGLVLDAGSVNDTSGDEEGTTAKTAASECDQNRRSMIVARHQELKRSDCKSPTKTTAQEFGISDRRVREIVRIQDKGNPLGFVEILLPARKPFRPQ